MDLYYKQEVSVGILVIIATAVFVLGLMWLSGIPFGSSRLTTVEARFEDIGGLSEGDPVYVSGVHVGRVLSVRLEDVGSVVARLEIPRSMPPHADARVSVGALDFLGSMKVDYVPGTSPTLHPEGQILVGSPAVGLLDGVPELKDNAAEVMVGLTEIVNSETATALLSTMEAAESALRSVASLAEGQADDAHAVVQTLQRITARLETLVANPALEESINQVDELTESFQEMADGLAGATSSLSLIMERIEAGEGSLGMALQDSTLHDDVHDLLTAMTALLDDMRERPGRYFRLKVF